MTKKYTLNELRTGMVVSTDQLSEIYNTYILLANPQIVDTDDSETVMGTIVFIGPEQNEECYKAFHTNIVNNCRPTIVYNRKEEIEEGAYQL